MIDDIAKNLEDMNGALQALSPTDIEELKKNEAFIDRLNEIDKIMSEMKTKLESK